MGTTSSLQDSSASSVIQVSSGERSIQIDPIQTDSVFVGSDQVLDNCSVCERKGRTNEVVDYCTACKEHFCQTCLDVHNSLPVLQCHTTEFFGKPLGDDALPAQGTAANKQSKRDDPSALTILCEEHTDRLVEIYCKTHDVVCCKICLTTKHKACTTEDVSKIADVLFSRFDVAKTICDLHKIKTDLSKIKSSREGDQTRIKMESCNVVTQIIQAGQRMSRTIQTDLNQCNQALGKIEATLKALEEENTQHKAKMFVNVKKGTEKMGEWIELSKQIQGHIGQESLTYTDRSQDAVNKEGTKTPTTDHLNRCTPSGACYLPDGGMLVTDFSNDRLKRTDALYNITGIFNIQRPVDVCYIPQTQEVVVCYKEGHVDIISLGLTINVVRKFQLFAHSHCGLAYSNGLLFIGPRPGKKIHVYNYASRHHKFTIEKDEHGHDIFSGAIYQIAASPDGSKIWVADFKKGLIHLDNSGKLLDVFTDPELVGATGVCVDTRNVFVCGYQSRTILQLSPVGKKICKLVQADDLPTCPFSLCYDSGRSQLVVTIYKKESSLKIFNVTFNN